MKITTKTIPNISRYNDLYRTVDSAKQTQRKVSILIPQYLQIGDPPCISLRLQDKEYSTVGDAPTSQQVIAMLKDAYPEEAVDLNIVESSNALGVNELRSFANPNGRYWVVFDRLAHGLMNTVIAPEEDCISSEGSTVFRYYFFSNYPVWLYDFIRRTSHKDLPKALKDLATFPQSVQNA